MKLNKRIVKTVCPRDCYDSCSMDIHLDEDGEIEKIKGDKLNPVTNGFLCPRGSKDGIRVHENRILEPSVRIGDKPGNWFSSVSWDDALSVVTKKIKGVISKYGNQALLHLYYAGNTGLLTLNYSKRIWYALGATETDGALCSQSGHYGIMLHFGKTYGVQPDELHTKKLIICWGFNTAVSAPHMWHQILIAKKENQAQVIVIDPRRTRTARSADLWISPKPGTDIVLAFGIASHLIKENLIDNEFITKWTNGFEEFKLKASKWTLNQVEEFTGVPKDQIKLIAEKLASLKPSVIMNGIGFQKSNQGADAVRIVALLPSLVGIHRGFYYSNSQAYDVNYDMLEGKIFPTQFSSKTVSQVNLPTFIEKGMYKFIFISGMNPALTLPNSTALYKGLMRDDVFVVVQETHLTETTKFADVILPASTFLEKDDVVIPWGHRYVFKSNKVLNSQGNSRDEIWIMNEMLKKLNFKDQWLWEDPWNVLKNALKNSFEDGDFEDLMNDKMLRLKCLPMNQYQTPRGKLEYVSTIAKNFHLNSLPEQEEMSWNEEEFVLLTSSTAKYTHTQFQETYGKLPCQIHINPENAKKLGIKNEDQITLYNEMGSVDVMVKISDDTPIGVIWGVHQFVGLNGNPQNILCTDKPQKNGGTATFNSTKVKIKK